MTIDFAKLREPFHASEIEWRIGRAGKNDKGIWATAFAYVTNRAIMQRLDEVCGPENWRNEFSVPPNAAPATAALCTIYIKVDGEWVGKSDGADNSDMESTKGGLSDSMKRAAVQWGIGRYLYDLDEGWVDVLDKKANDARYQPANDKKSLPAFYWKPPQLPTWALPGNKPPKSDLPPGVTTGDRVPPPAGKKKTPKEQAQDKLFAETASRIGSIADITKIETAIKFTEDQRVAGNLTQAHYEDLGKLLAGRAVEVCEELADFEKADKLILGLIGKMRLTDQDGTELRIKLSDAKDAKLGAAA